MIQAVLHLHFCTLLDWEQPRDLIEAEEDLRDAVVEETGRMRFDSCPIEEVEEYAAWLCNTQEAEDAIEGCDAWRPDDLPELERAFLRRLLDHENDLRDELPTAAE